MSKRRYQQRHNCITVIPTDEKSPTKNFKMDTLAFTEDNYLQDEILDDIKQGTIAPCSQPEKQIKIPVDEFESSVIKPEKKFVKWYAAPAEGEPSRDYWTATQYYVSEESLKAGAGPQIENGATLQDGGVWVAGPDAHLLRIPTTEAELNSTFFKKQNCIPNMGTHYYYNMTRKMDCEEMLLWFALITDSELVGTGFQTIGKLNKKNLKDRNWFETVPGARRATELAIPHAPDCLRDWTEKYGVISMHIYYTNKPWEIRCKSGDSIKPGPPLDRLILNGLRYANQISDEVQKLFSG